ncbi:MAG: urease accessory protein [Nitrosopumilales archaeon]|nr:urease accessory protein [Nitrosopumilales archaeon]
MNIHNASIEEISMLQLSDSFFPSGMYTTSGGLEALYYSNRKITDADQLRDLIKVYLEHQIGPADCSALGNSYEHIQRNDLQKLVEVDNMIFSMKLIEEVRNASTRSGTQVLRCVSSFRTDNRILNGYQEAITGLMMLYGFSVSMVGAALRLGVLQHFDGQRIIHELKPSISETVEKNIDRPLTSMWQFAPDIDILQIAHERMSSKMFIT